MTSLVFLIASLAVSRVADILAEESGPFAIFSRLRRKVPAKTNAGQGVRCPFCVSVHIAALTTAWLWWIEQVPGNLAVLYAFGLSGAAAAIRKATE